MIDRLSDLHVFIVVLVVLLLTALLSVSGVLKMDGGEWLAFVIALLATGTATQAVQMSQKRETK